MEWCRGLSEGDRPPKVLEAGSSGPQPISPGYRVRAAGEEDPGWGDGEGRGTTVVYSAGEARAGMRGWGRGQRGDMMGGGSRRGIERETEWSKNWNLGREFEQNTETIGTQLSSTVSGLCS